MKTELTMLYVPVSSEQEAKDLARGLLHDGLIACANIIPSMQSIYVWDGKVEEGSEAILILKSSQEKLSELKIEVKKRHSYTTPCILELDVSSINGEYEDWILDALKNKKP